jgi:hypothetical protein
MTTIPNENIPTINPYTNENNPKIDNPKSASNLIFLARHNGIMIMLIINETITIIEISNKSFSVM